MSATRAPAAEAAFRHEALLYQGIDDFVVQTGGFIRGGVTAEEPVLVVVSRAKIELLRDALGGDAAGVTFADMDDVGGNPARIIPAWRDFVDRHAGTGRRFRGVGEPIWPDRRGAELVECQRHERLLNVAFGGAPAWWLVCPYDVAALDPAVIDEAARSHRFMRRGETAVPGAADGAHDGATLEAALAEPPPRSQVLGFDAGSLVAVRSLACRRAARAGMPLDRIADLATAVNEVATNSVRHGGGGGTFHVWDEGGVVICEVRDGGRIADPLVDRTRPEPGAGARRGLWLANQLCDLVQLRSSESGTRVRLLMRARRDQGAAA